MIFEKNENFFIFFEKGIDFSEKVWYNA